MSLNFLLPNDDGIDAAGLAAFLHAGVDGVKQRGGAAVGDKTVVDAMEPAAIKAAEVSADFLGLRYGHPRRQDHEALASPHLIYAKCYALTDYSRHLYASL